MHIETNDSVMNQKLKVGGQKRKKGKENGENLAGYLSTGRKSSINSSADRTNFGMRRKTNKLLSDVDFSHIPKTESHFETHC